MCNQLLLSVLETVRTAESRSHDLTANPVTLTQLLVVVHTKKVQNKSLLEIYNLIVK